MDAQSPEALYRTMPVVTRAVMTATFFVTLASVLKMFNPSYLLLDWILVAKKLHFWRLVTDYLFVGPFSFSWVFHMYFFVSFSSRLEKHPCFASRGSYLYFLFLQMLGLDMISGILFYPAGRPVLAPALSFAIIYYWSKKEPFAPVGLWGFTLTAWQLPYALFVLDLLMGQSILHGLMGLATGHIYHFVKDILPAEKNIHFLRGTPDLFALLTDKLDFMSATTHRPAAATSSSSSQRPTSAPQQSAGARISSLFTSFHSTDTETFPGRGYRLGGDTASSTDNPAAGRNS